MDRIGESHPPPDEALKWALGCISRADEIVAVQSLGGTWHANHAIDVLDRDGRLHRLVLRRWARPDWDLADPELTADREAAILELLSSSLVPSPLLVAADPAGQNCDVPALLLRRLPGDPPRQREAPDPHLDQLAAVLQLIHSVDGGASRAVPAYRRYYDPDRIVLPDWLEAPLWNLAVEAVARPAPAGPTCFIHRDYHPGNTLWSEGRLTGVVDWTQGSWGPPSVDLGHMRWNLAIAYGPEVAARFLDLYRARPGDLFEHDPYWDLVTLVDLMADVGDDSPLTPRDLDRLERYLAEILMTT